MVTKTQLSCVAASSLISSHAQSTTNILGFKYKAATLFIAYALHWTKLHSSVTFALLVSPQCLKARFPTARSLSGHRLFISAFMIASRVICDDTYSDKSWSVVGQGMFLL
jgi:hypothetical protein